MTATGLSLAQELGSLVDELSLDDRQKHFMRARWLDQVLWLERKATQAQQRYYALRLVGIVGGLVVPALVSLNLHRADTASAIAWTTFSVSLVVAIAIAVEGFFNYGGRWRRFRRTAEQLKGEGWQFSGLAGTYAAYRTHNAAFRPFAAAVESLIAQDVESYLTRVAREQHRAGETGGQEQPGGDAEPAS